MLEQERDYRKPEEPTPEIHSGVTHLPAPERDQNSTPPEDSLLETYIPFMSELSSDPDSFLRGAEYAYAVLRSPSISGEAMRIFNARVHKVIRSGGLRDAEEILSPKKHYIDKRSGNLRSMTMLPAYIEEVLGEEEGEESVLVRGLDQGIKNGVRFMRELYSIQKDVDLQRAPVEINTNEPMSLPIAS